MSICCFISDGQFGAYMQVSIQNDGPVTFEIESPSHAQDKVGKNTKSVIQNELSNGDAER